jgi:hypothetical protein
MTRRTASGDRWPPSNARIRALIEEAVVDAHDDDEQIVAIFARRLAPANFDSRPAIAACTRRRRVDRGAPCVGTWPVT